MDAFVHTEIQATPLAARIDEATYLAIARDTRSVLSEYEQPDVTVSFPIRARFSAGRNSGEAGATGGFSSRSLCLGYSPAACLGYSPAARIEAILA